MLRALTCRAGARFVAKALFLRVLRGAPSFEAAVRDWLAVWDQNRLRVEVHEPELWLFGTERLALRFDEMPPTVLRALVAELPSFGSAHVNARGRAVLRNYAHDATEDVRALAARLWRILMAEMPPELRARARKARYNWERGRE